MCNYSKRSFHDGCRSCFPRSAKLDSLLAGKDFDAAENHLKYWAADARASGDERALLTVINEQIGFYKKPAKSPKRYPARKKRLSLPQYETGRCNAPAFCYCVFRVDIVQCL